MNVLLVSIVRYINDTLTLHDVLPVQFMLNLAAYYVFGRDKLASKKQEWRIPEFTLLVFCFLTPFGSLFAIYSLRHKTRLTKCYFPALCLVGLYLIFTLNSIVFLCISSIVALFHTFVSIEKMFKSNSNRVSSTNRDAIRSNRPPAQSSNYMGSSFSNRFGGHSQVNRSNNLNIRSNVRTSRYEF